MGTLVLLDLMGGVALLLWGLHMVHSGILRAFGPDLRRLLGKALSNRFSAFAAGLGLTALLQSSTATALITSSFAAEGLVSVAAALAIMLGANVGTTLIVQVLSFNIAAAAPVLFVFGLVAFRAGPRSRIKDIGRVLIGLGLMLLSLHILLDTLAPAENAPGVRAMMSAITGDPVLCIVIAALVTWAVHSSVASVLLIMSLAYSQFITPYAALALVLGANLGSAINPVFEGARRDDAASYRLPVGNLVNRVIGIALVLPFLGTIAEHMHAWQPDLAKMTAAFHIAFNVGTAVIFIGLLDTMSRLLTRLLPDRVKEDDPARPRYLDESALETPSLALADAAREALRMGDFVEVMLRKVMAAMMTGDRALVDQVSKSDNVVGRPRRSHQALRDEIDAGQPRRERGPAGDGDHLLRHQSGTYRRHHRQESERTRHQEDQAPLSVLARGCRGARRLPQAHDGLAAHRLRHLHVGRRQRGAQAAGREDGAAQHRACRSRAPPRPPARGPPRDPRDHVAASRRAARFAPHPFAHLLGRLSRARRGGRALSQARSRYRRPARSRCGVGVAALVASDQRSSVCEPRPRFLMISMMLRI
ncbi:Na/Pi-cotransporter [Bradyrhizobium sp. LB7.1]